jgi:GPI mannosyltransferase 2
MLPDHTSLDAFNPPKVNAFNCSLSWPEKLFETLFIGYKHWDAVHFTHIAQYGYIYEHSAAFFPLYPFSIRLFAEPLVYILKLIVGSENSHCIILSTNSIYLLASVILNFVYFITSAIFLYKLTMIVFNNEKSIAQFSLVLFCLNPANIFFSAAYSESLYSMLTLISLYFLFKRDPYYIHPRRSTFLYESSLSLYFSLVLFSLACLCRSNGILNLGFFVYVCLKVHLWSVNPSVKLKATNCDNNKTKLTLASLKRICLHVGFIKFLITTTVALIFTSASFLLFQFYIYKKFCERPEKLEYVITTIPVELIEYAKKNTYHLYYEYEKKREWCTKFLPISYSYIQANYWNVGFLNYWRWQQIPNFLLATPIIYFGVRSFADYLISLESSNFYGLLGLFPQQESKKNLSKSDEKKNYDYFSIRHFEANYALFPFSLHLLGLIISSVFFMHVQV